MFSNLTMFNIIFLTEDEGKVTEYEFDTMWNDDDGKQYGEVYVDSDEESENGHKERRGSRSIVKVDYDGMYT